MFLSARREFLARVRDFLSSPIEREITLFEKLSVAQELVDAVWRRIEAALPG
jgi:hypothetical protein